MILFRITSFNRYKDTFVEWLPQIPEHWVIQRINDCAQPRNKKNHGLINTNLLSLSYGKIVNKDFNTSFGLLPTSFETYQIVTNGNLILRLTDLQNDKKSLRVGLVTQTGIITSAYLCLQFLKGYNSTFAYYLLYSYDISKIFYRYGGGLRSTMKYDDIKVLPFFSPTLHEQTTIANYLDEKTALIDKKINLLTQKAVKYKELKQALIKETVTRGLDKNVKLKDSGVDWLGEIPVHWEVKRFKEIFQKTHTGWTPDTAIQSSYDGDNVWVTIRDMNDSVIIDSANKLSDEAISVSGIPTTPKGSILFSFKLSIGQIAFAGTDLYTNEAIISIEKCKGVNLNYFFYTLPIFLTLNAKENIYGAKILNQSLIFNAPLIYLLLSEQTQIAEYLDKKTSQIDKIVESINKQIEKLKELRKTLINDVVTGKIKVTE